MASNEDNHAPAETQPETCEAQVENPANKPDESRREREDAEAQPEYRYLRKEQERLIRQRDDAERKIRQLRLQPFLDETLMTDDNPPDCSAGSFEQPRLRKCPFQFKDINRVTSVVKVSRWQDVAHANGGMDGFNWKVMFKGVDDGPFVMKVFWDYEAPKPGYYYAAQREAQNVAILQQFQEALSPQNASHGPILVVSSAGAPLGKTHAKFNLGAFSEEQRAARKEHPETRITRCKEVTSMPRFRKCYGWLKISGDELKAKFPPQHWPPPLDIDKIHRQLYDDTEYTAIIYEYVEEAENVLETMQETIDFLEQTGFCMTLSPLKRNWKNSILIDMSDFISCVSFGFEVRRKGLKASELLD